MRLLRLQLACLGFLAVAPSVSARNLCEPTPEIERAIGEVLGPLPPDAPLELRLEALRLLRARFEGDLFVHLRYQDEVFERGIEGHLREMAEEYLALRAAHEGDAFYSYLAGRAFEGRGTKRAIAIMEQVLAIDPEFAPAHRTLAEIYGSKAFRDARKEREARHKLAATCPNSAIVHRPTPLPPHGTFFARLRETGLTQQEEEAIPGEVQKALLQDEWRALRIRLFDWYSPGEQRRALHELQAEYWQAWSVLVRHYRRTGQKDEAGKLLAEMEDRLVRLGRSRRGTTFALAARTVLGLYAEGKQPQSMRAALSRLKKSLDEHPDPKLAAELKRLQAAFSSRL